MVVVVVVVATWLCGVSECLIVVHAQSGVIYSRSINCGLLSEYMCILFIYFLFLECFVVLECGRWA